MTKIFLRLREDPIEAGRDTERLERGPQPSGQTVSRPGRPGKASGVGDPQRALHGQGSYSVPGDEQKALFVTDAEFDRIVGEALESLPDWVNDTMDNIVFAVADWPSPEQAAEGDELLGLYEGVSLLDRGNTYSAVLPDTITIFKQPHLALGLDPDELRNEIRITVLHEIAHHLGMDEERLHELGWD
ncbi:MAG: metallopeptidase family protein [Acidimicrobiia bacterium]|nr:metallopeptidase family protein [Acidimicrobiia bacterium]MDH5504727.1 metallopeptidase family protein [Acidimicrobiia bacterium]